MSYRPEQIAAILADYDAQIEAQRRRKPADHAGASATAPAERLAKLIARRDAFAAKHAA